VRTSKFAALAAGLFVCSMAVSAQAQSTSVPMTAEPATQPVPAAAAKPGRDPNQVICRREEEIGSRLGGHKECHTRAEWEQISRDSSDATAQMQNNAHFNANPGH
jgi:hypothetical protein